MGCRGWVKWLPGRWLNGGLYEIPYEFPYERVFKERLDEGPEDRIFEERMGKGLSRRANIVLAVGWLREDRRAKVDSHKNNPCSCCGKYSFCWESACPCAGNTFAPYKLISNRVFIYRMCQLSGMTLFAMAVMFICFFNNYSGWAGSLSAAGFIES